MLGMEPRNGGDGTARDETEHDKAWRYGENDEKLDFVNIGIDDQNTIPG